MVSVQFPLIWKTSGADYAYINSSGNTGTTAIEVNGSAVNKNEKVISVDGLLLNSFFVNNLDEAMSHFDVRSIYAKEAGIELGTQWDKNVLQQALLGARSAALVSGGNGGTVLTNASYGTSGATLGSGLFDAAEQLDENNVECMDQYAQLFQRRNALGDLNRLAAELLEIDDKRPEAWVCLALYHESRSDHEKALGKNVI